MVADETVVTVIDLGTRARDRSRPEGPLPGSPGILEGALLVTVGLTTAAVEAVTRAVMTALGETLHPRSERRRGSSDPGRRVRDRGDDRRRRARGRARGNPGGDTCGRGVDRAIRPMSLVASIPFVDRAAQRLERSSSMNDTWRDERTESMAIAEAFADAMVPDLVEAMVAHLDLTQLVLERVDLDEVVTRVDLDAVVERLDLDAIVERLDIDAVAARIDVERSSAARPGGDRGGRDRGTRPCDDHPRVDRDDGHGDRRWCSGPERPSGPARVPRGRSDPIPSRRSRSR